MLRYLMLLLSCTVPSVRSLNAVFAREAAAPAMRETQLLVNYRGSRIFADERPEMDAASPAPGDRVPEVVVLPADVRRPYAHIGWRSHPCSKGVVRGWLRLSIQVD
jgi:hypothetical protein